MSWADDELSGINLGDERLNKRSVKILDALGGNPNISIPAACNGHHETKAAYRFFDNPDVKATKILQPHNEATYKRMTDEKIILCVQDTTEIDFTGQKENPGIGFLNTDNRRGLFLHPTLAVTPDRICLGVIHAHTWRREKLRHHKTAEEKRADKKLSIEKRESYRWLKSYDAASDLASRFPDKTIVSVGDRECDFYEFFAAAEDKKNKASFAHWLIRLKHDRLTITNNNDEEIKKDLRELAAKSPVLGHVEFILRARDGKKERKIKQTVQVVRAKIVAPPTLTTKIKSLEITAIITKEINTPSGEDPIEWILLTSINIDNNDQAFEIIRWYLARWEIEIFFKILKSGCKIEKLQLETENRIDSCLAIYMIVAWRILFLTMLGRKCPDMPCDTVFQNNEWKALYEVSNRKKAPEKPLSLNEMICLVASLGGHLNRKGDGFPGPKKMWIGMQRMRDFAIAREALMDIYG